MKVKMISLSLVGVLVSSTAMAQTLNEAVNQALQHNPEVVSAVKGAETVSHEVREARSGYYPSVDLELGTGWENSNNVTTRSRPGRGNGDKPSRDLWRNESRISATQMLYDGRQTKSRVEVQEARLLSAGNHLEETKEIIALRAIDAYLDVLRATENVALAEANLKKHADYVKQISSRAESGASNRADVRQAEGRYSLAQANLLEFQREQQDAEAFFKQIVGEMPADLVPSKAPHDSLPVSFDTALERALANNPAILSDLANIEAAKSGVKEVKSAFRPRITAELSHSRNVNLDGSKGTNNDTLAMIRLRQNLYRGGADVARKKAKKSEVAENEARLENTKRVIEEELRKAWHALQSSRLRMVPLSQHVVSAEQTRDAYKKQFDLGQRSLLDLLDAEIEVFNAKVNLVDEKFTHDFAAYGILANAGDLTERFTIVE